MRNLRNREGFQRAIRSYLLALGIIPQSELETVAEDITVLVEQHLEATKP